MASHFPTELFESIVDSLWSLRLSANERVNVMTTMPLINSVWRSAYIRLSSKDVYIPCISYSVHFLSILRRGSKETQACFEARCRSITFLIDHPPAPQQGSTLNHPAAKVMADFLYFTSDDLFPFLSNLRKIAIHYHNMSFDDIFEYSRLVDFPSQVTELEIVHTFSPEVPRFLISALQDKDENYLNLSWRMPHITHLTLAGVGSDYVANMAIICPNLVKLELGLADPKIYVAVPSSVRCFIVHSPDSDLVLDRLPPEVTHVFYLPSVNIRSRMLYFNTKVLDDGEHVVELTYPSTETWERCELREMVDDGQIDDDKNHNL
jgi:hypothetical protein